MHVRARTGITPQTIYGTVNFYRKLQKSRENNDISRVKAFYQILQVGNLENLPRLRLVSPFSPIN